MNKLVKMIGFLNGPNTLGNSKGFWIIFSSVLIYLFVFPLFGSLYSILNWSYFFLHLGVSLGLSLLWGYLGVLSFGQMAFFGIAGYTYGIVAINLGGELGTLTALLIGLATTVGVAAFFGYFVFYGRVSGWIVPILTLAFTLILETFMGQTAGYQWRVGKALLGGYNGMTGIPILLNLDSISFYYFVVITMVLIYLGLRILVNSDFGYKIVAIRESSQRAEALGLNTCAVQLLVFVIAAGLAGFSGILYASWASYMVPSLMGLVSATIPVIWVAIGGRKSLLAVIIMTLFLQYISQNLAVFGGEYALVIYGALLLFGMVFTPEGLIVTIVQKVCKEKKFHLTLPRFAKLSLIFRNLKSKG